MTSQVKHCRICGRIIRSDLDVCDYHASLLIAQALGLRKKEMRKIKSSK